jgi:hypothetical protein
VKREPVDAAVTDNAEVGGAGEPCATQCDARKAPQNADGQAGQENYYESGER